VVWLVMREVLRWFTGVLIGLPAAYTLSWAFDRSCTDRAERSASMLLATLLLTGVALLAGIFQRAARAPMIRCGCAG